MNKPKVSIVVPVYNVEKYLDRCMQSLLNQTLEEIEIILVDDESPDNCSVMCDEYAKQDRRVKVIHKKNEGLGLARNSGLEIATGEYVAFVDSDDFVDLNMYSYLYKITKNEKLDACYCGFVFYKNGKTISKSEVKKNTFLKGRKEVDDFMLDMIAPEPSYHSDVKYMMSSCKVLYSKEIIDRFQLRFCSERNIVSEDLIFNVDFLQKTFSIGFLPNSFYYYCTNGAITLSNTYSKAKFVKNKVFLDEVKYRLSLLFPKGLYINRYYRLCFLYLRVSLKQELKSQKTRDINVRKHIMKELVNDSYFESMFNQYPYLKLPWKHRFLFLLLKYKCYNILSIVF